MSTWDGPLGVFDLETTGVDTDVARIVSACIAVLDSEGRVTARWDWLVDPGVEVPEGASAVHGITTERVRAEGRPAEAAIAEIAQTLRVLFSQGIPLTVYNAPYDLTLLDRECRRHAIEPVEHPQPVVDPLVIDKAVDRYRRGKRTLEVTAEFYGVALDGAHDAGADAICAGRVAQAIARAYPDELGVSAGDLHGRQEIWFADQQQNFEEYVRTKPGREGYVADRSWPVRPVGHPNTFVDTQPLPPLPPQPGRVPIVDFSEFDQRRLAAPTVADELRGAPGVGPQAEDLRRAPEVPLTTLVESISITEVEVEVESTPAPAVTTVLRVAAAIVTDPAGRALVVRKRGTELFMQAGGKVEPGESALEALTRELREELELELDADQAEYLGIFRAPAAHESDTIVSAAVFAVAAADGLQPHGEIEELRWITSLDTDLPLAPLTRDELLPLWEQRRTSSDGALF